MTGALAGALTGLLAFIPLYDKPNFPLRSLIATLAISLMGGQGLLWLFTPRVKALPKIFGVGSIHIGPATASYDKIGAIVCSAILLLLTLGWMKGSRRGLEIRAMMQNPEGAALVGVGLRSTAMAVMMVTGAMAGLASVLLSQTYFISPFAGTTPLVKGMVVALAGGLGSVAGALIAAVLIGFVEALHGGDIGRAICIDHSVPLHHRRAARAPAGDRRNDRAFPGIAVAAQSDSQEPKAPGVPSAVGSRRWLPVLRGHGGASWRRWRYPFTRRTPLLIETDFNPVTLDGRAPDP